MITFKDLVVAMQKCQQTPGQSVYEHGVSVDEHFKTLIRVLESNDLCVNWDIPDWAYEYKDKLLSNLHDKNIVSTYLLYHDIGKPWCKEVDNEGKIHFPNHAEVSKRIFLDSGGDKIVGDLIGWDMCIHTETSECIQNRLTNEWSAKDACTLLLASLAEIHGNAKMFGGISSQSFKQKLKKIDRRGKQICKYLF